MNIVVLTDYGSLLEAFRSITAAMQFAEQHVRVDGKRVRMDIHSSDNDLYRLDLQVEDQDYEYWIHKMEIH